MTWRWIAWGSIGAVLAVRAAASLGVRVVETPSVPMGFYMTREPKGLVARGEYACLPVEGPLTPALLQSLWAGGRLPARWKSAPLFKRVLGVSGDVVAADPSGGVRINGALVPHSKAERFDANGEPLPRPTLPIVLAAGDVWLASEHERGFDSRYFGPVRSEALSCVGEPLWTW